MRDTAELLQGTDLFSELSLDDCRRLAERSGSVTVGGGHRFTEQGVADPNLQIIVAGSADVFVHGETVRTLGVGDYFGEVSLLDNAPRSATIVAGDGGCTTVLIPQLEFWDTVDQHPHVVRPLLRGLSARLRSTEDALWELRRST